MGVVDNALIVNDAGYVPITVVLFEYLAVKVELENGASVNTVLAKVNVTVPPGAGVLVGGPLIII
jgi:hypothetical protein